MKIFITGGTSGIGLALANFYLNQGHEVAICGRDLSKLTETFKAHPSLKTYQLDVKERDKLMSAMDDFAQVYRVGIDLVIANAGRSVGNKQPLPDWKTGLDVMETNIMGFCHTFEAGLKHMLAQKSGHLVSISSVAGFIGLPGTAAYSASKAAVSIFCESLAIDLRSYGISTTTICPGFIDTPLTRQNKHVMPFLMEADQAAEKIARAIARRKVLYIFPWPMKLIIILLDKMPRACYRFLMGVIGRKLLSKGKHHANPI